MANYMKIQYDGTEFNFAINLTYQQVRKIIDGYSKPFTANIPHWWYKKTDFGMYFLNALCVDADIEDIPEVDWVSFIPVLKHYFITYKEFKDIVHNVCYLNGIRSYPIENTSFMNYILIKEFCNFEYKNLIKLPYKRVVSLYLYSLSNRMIENTGLDPLKDVIKDIKQMYR